MSKGAQTRQTILRVAFEQIYANGYNATSIDEILKKTHVTKGSFFHHFKNKEEMGLAVITEVLSPGMQGTMIAPLLSGHDPVQEIYRMMEGLLMDEEHFNVKYGCPAVNMIDEMAPLAPSFNSALHKLSSDWQHAIVESLEKAQTLGKIGKDNDLKSIAIFIISGYGGVRNLGKMYGKSYYKKYLSELKSYLERL